MPVTPPVYPVHLVVAGRRVLVVGAGRVAARKAAGLLACGASVHVVAPDIGADMAALATGEERLAVERRPYQRGEVAGYDLVFVATGVTSVDQAVYDDAISNHVWVNSADDPERCSFILPSVARRGPITLGVSTAGTSPAMAVFVRRRLAESLGPEFEALAQMVASERAARRAAGQSTEGLNWQSALDSDMLDLVRAGQLDRARERLQACLTSSS